MNCLESLELLQARLDGTAIAAPALDAHLAGCADCRARHLAGTTLAEVLKSLPRPAPSFGFADRIVAGVLADRRLRQNRFRVFAGAALAASLLIAAWIAYNLVPPGGDSLPDNGGMVEIKKVPGAADVALSQRVQEARTAMASLTERIADKTTSPAKLLIAAAAPAEVPDLPRFLDGPTVEEPIETSTASILQAGAGVAEGLEPVARSARRALSFFARELPVLETKN